ncbi:chemotaxis protein CheA [Erythrobacter sp. HKB08]|uniref:chemotaxis protein CheA n=1 Tax=Erythrobacter sp. HKB08 TaxID=2502843 RepID=UPI00100930D1|nr:chemotaxis protein CheA [Erythrobacter sp. HKB08]
MDDLLADFVAETREMLEAIEGEIVAWEAEPSDRARLDAIFRFVHTVKGNCGFFDFPRLEKLSHAAEGALAEVRAGRRSADSRLVNAVLAIIDRITHMVDAIENGKELPEGGDEYLIGALEPDASDTGECAAMQAANAAATKTSGSNSQANLRSIRLPVELLDRVMSGVSDMVLARNDLARRLRESGAEPTLDGPFERLSGILTDVREAVTKMRMQRIENLYNALPRLVRDLSAELGKQVMVDLDGGDVELDREMIEMMRDPITHIIRNAVDHGIETPAVRMAAGKREIGLLSISARQSGNRITMTISDDGAGLNAEKIGAKAVKNGLLSEAELAKLSEEELVDLIFEPGLSTAEEVSSISGRGVGMDVVRANLEKVGGSISVTTNPGHGTQFDLQIPLTLSIISALTVSVSGQRFAIPQSYVEEIAHSTTKTIEFSRVGDTHLMTFRGRRIPCLTLAGVLATGDEAPDATKKLVLLRMGANDLFAMAVDAIHDQEDLVVKPLAPSVMKTGLYAGTTLLDDGRPVLMLDIPAIAQRSGLVSQLRSRRIASETRQTTVRSEVGRKLMTFVGFDGRRYAVAMELVSRIDQVPVEAIDHGDGQARVVIGEKIFPLSGLGANADCGEQVKLLRLSDGDTEVCHAAAELDETIEVLGAIDPAPEDVTLEGIVLDRGAPVRVLDAFRLFAGHARSGNAEERAVCRIYGDDEWTQRMLRPLVESAGYAIADSDEEAASFAIIAGDDAQADPAIPSLRVFADPAEAARNDNGVYRYDRAALIEALARVSQEKIA